LIQFIAICEPDSTDFGKNLSSLAIRRLALDSFALQQCAATKNGKHLPTDGKRV
jgi:hypothetical protein